VSQEYKIYFKIGKQ